MITAAELATDPDSVIVDCRFVLGDPEAGRAAYLRGHIPRAHYLDLERDLSGPAGVHGGRHPLPSAEVFVARLAALGIGPATPVVAYDDSRLAHAARFWWLLRALGYRPPRLLAGGLAAWVAAGEALSTTVPDPVPCSVAPTTGFRGSCDIEALRALQATGGTLLDSREARRYAGLEEPIDPVAGHIPGALNRCWQDVTDQRGVLRPATELRRHFGELLEARPLVVYCGSGVTACVNLYALDRLGRDDALLYPGSWSDWCSYL